MSNTVRVGIVGYGYASKTFHAPLIASVPGLHLTTISSSDPAKVHADWPDIAVEASPDALFARADLDLLVIPTPNNTHYPLARRALTAGKHVVVDKPFTVTLAEARDLQALAEQNGRVLSVFHNRRWDADFLTVRQLISTGDLGRIVAFESHFDRYRPEVQTRWREQVGPGSGLWYDLGPHLLDQALQLFGLPEALQADLACQRDDAQTDDYFHVQLRYDRMRVILHGSVLVPAPGPRFVVHGTQGSYVKYGLDPQEAVLKVGRRPPAIDWGADPCDGVLTLWQDGTAHSGSLPTIPGTYPVYYAAVRDAILGQAPNPVPPTDALQVMALLELGSRSRHERRELPVTGTDGVV